MSAPVEFTGERFLPECTGEIWAEHWHRYLFAARLVTGLDVLDAACGEGYGSALLAKGARGVTGLDIDQDTVTQSRSRYQAPNLRFEAGSVSAMPFPDASFDCVVSFETLEHLAEQEAMLAEIRRVLRPDGFAIISTPNRVEYSDKRNFRNEFHVRELYEREFRELLARHFGAQRWYGQRLLFNSAMWSLSGDSTVETPDAQWITVAEGDPSLPPPMYFVAIVAGAGKSLPRDEAGASLLADPDDSIYREYESTVARARTLEQLVAERERIVIERDRQIELHDRNARRFEAVIAEREEQLLAQTDRATTMEQLIAERERVIVERDEEAKVKDASLQDRERIIGERDALLAAINSRVSEAERLIGERDAQLDAASERFATIEALLAERERIIVERDAQLGAFSDREQTLQRLVAERERLVVERDLLLAQMNARLRDAESLIGERERLVVERDGQLAATNERMALAEKVIGEREAAIEARQRAIAALEARIAGMEARIAGVEATLAETSRRLAERTSQLELLSRDNLALRTEVVRRASWRWWLSLPLRRIRGTVPTSVAEQGNDG